MASRIPKNNTDEFKKVEKTQTQWGRCHLKAILNQDKVGC